MEDHHHQPELVTGSSGSSSPDHGLSQVNEGEKHEDDEETANNGESGSTNPDVSHE